MIRELVSYDWMTIFIIGCLMTIVIAKQLYKVRFNDFLVVFGNSNYLKIYAREQKFIDSFDGLLFGNLCISAGIFLFFCYTTFISTIEFNLILFLKLILAICIFVLVKTLLERLIGSVFDFEQILDPYLFQKITFKNLSGLALLGANIFIIYSNLDRKILIYITIGIIFLLNTIGFVTSYKSERRKLTLNFFYFLLYLCALEIGPYVLLYKVIKEYYS